LNKAKNSVESAISAGALPTGKRKPVRIIKACIKIFPIVFGSVNQRVKGGLVESKGKGLFIPAAMAAPGADFTAAISGLASGSESDSK